MRISCVLMIAMALGPVSSVYAQTPAPASFISWATTNAVPLPDCTAQSDSQSLHVMSPIIGHAHVVALGEPTHGTHEPLALRNCLFRYLVEREGFTAIAIESGLGESRRLQDYVAGGPGDATKLVRESLSWGFWRFEENVALIEWMHNYNSDPTHLSKIRFYGIDMSGGERSGEWRNAPTTLAASLIYLSRIAPERSRHLRDSLSPFQDRFTLPGYAALSEADKVRLRSDIRRLIKFFARERDTLIAASTESDFAWAERNAVLAKQLEAEFRVSRPADSGDELQPDDYRADAVRDAAMADNVRWVIDREGTSGRIMLFAHNGHVMNAANRGGIWSVYRKAPQSMGQHLRKELGAQVRIIAISSAFTDEVGSADHQESTTFDRALAELKQPPFVLNLRAPKTGEVRHWLSSDQSMRTNMTTQSIFVPRDAVDAVIFFDHLTLSTPAAQQ